MRTKIFAYKGLVGIDSHPDAEGLVAKPGNGNLGCVSESTGVDVSKEALELLKQVPKSHDDIGDFDVFQAGDKVIIAWLGGYKKAFYPKQIEGSSSYSPNLIIPAEDVEPTKEFKDFVDKNIK